MTDDDRVLRLLGDVLDRQPTTAPDRLLTTVLDEVRTAPQRRRWFIPSWRDLLAAPSLTRLAVVGLVVAVIAIAMFQLTPRSALVGPGATSTSSPTIAPSAASSQSTTPTPTAAPSRSTTPTPTTEVSPSPKTTPSASEAVPVSVEDLGRTGRLLTGTTYTSRLFEPSVTFKLAARQGSEGTTGEETDWCSPLNMDTRVRTSADTVVLSHPHACTDTLSFFHPYAVDCGTPDSHPDAATLAAALLAHPDVTGAVDVGDLQSTVPSNMFSVDSSGAARSGRVIEVVGSVSARPSGEPGHCQLLARPGTGTPSIQIPDGHGARLIFVDVDGGLVVVKVTAPITIQAHLLSRIYDIQFGQSPPPDPSTSPVPYPTVTSHLPDGVEVEIPTGFTMHFTPAQVERLALDRIAQDERRLGRVLLPARVLKVAAIPAGTVYWATRRDGTNPDGSGLGPDAAPGWVVVAEGTFVGVNHQTDTIDSHGTLGYFGFDDMDNGGEGRIFIPCWFASPVPDVQLEGNCP